VRAQRFATRPHRLDQRGGKPQRVPDLGDAASTPFKPSLQVSNLGGRLRQSIGGALHAGVPIQRLSERLPNQM
jgi:hypothetical protein